MLNKFSVTATALSLTVLAGCSTSTPYTATPVQATAIDTTAYAPKVESFVVVMDTSSSMGEDSSDRVKLHIAQDVAASFNATVPPGAYRAGLVSFGNSTGRCLGRGEASTVYGLSTFQASELGSAVNSFSCAGGTTPMAAGLDEAADMLAAETGPVAVFLISDFRWIDTAAVTRSAAALRAKHGDNLCLHTIKVGHNTTGDTLLGELNRTPGCDSAVNASEIASSAAMATYVSETLLAPLQYEKHSVSATALFDFNKSDLKEQGKAELHNLGELIKSQGIRVADIDVVGHTDSIGSAEYNQRLSERRAMAVKDYMVSEGVSAAVIDAIGKGESDPTASNDTEEGRALNRRVDIHVGSARPMQ